MGECRRQRQQPTAVAGGLGEATGGHLPNHLQNNVNTHTGQQDELVGMMKEMINLLKSDRDGSARGRGYSRG